MTRLLTTQDVATRFRVKPCTVREWAKVGKLPGFKVPGSTDWLFDPADITRVEKLWKRQARSEYAVAQA